VLVGVSSSPYVAIGCLVLTALTLRVKVGVLFIRWFFFTLVIVYVGGIMVIFIYLRRLVQSTKITLVGARGYLLRALLLSLLRRVSLLSVPGRDDRRAWVAVSYSLRRGPLAVFGALYLLGALLSVYRLCQKGEGPIKTH